MSEEPTLIDIALRAADAGDAGHWPTVAGILAEAYREQKTRISAAQAENASLLLLLADIRQALGDDGKRMQPELVEYCRGLFGLAELVSMLAESKRYELSVYQIRAMARQALKDRPLVESALKAANGGDHE